MNKIDELKLAIQQAQQQINEIQNACSHPPACVAKLHQSDTGNWRRGDDRYWTNFTCSLCEKKWTEEGSK